MRLRVFSFAMLLSLLAVPAQAADVGEVTAVVKRANAIAETGVRVLKLNASLLAQDLVSTGDGARLHAAFKDGSVLMLGENATLRIDEFVYGTGESPSGVLNLTEGAFRWVSGAISKQGGGQLTFNTPVATIGIRGTDFWGLQAEGQMLLALLDDGELEVTAGGETFIMTDPMTVVVLRQGQEPGEIQELSAEAFAEASDTVSIPE